MLYCTVDLYVVLPQYLDPTLRYKYTGVWMVGVVLCSVPFMRSICSLVVYIRRNILMMYRTINLSAALMPKITPICPPKGVFHLIGL